LSAPQTGAQSAAAGSHAAAAESCSRGSTEPIHPAVRVGHIHLRVADLDRAIAFYRDVLGFNVTADGREAGIDAAFLPAGDYHHHIGVSNSCTRACTPADEDGRDCCVRGKADL
jgi:catechol-2,3-dioxygenase